MPLLRSTGLTLKIPDMEKGIWASPNIFYTKNGLNGRKVSKTTFHHRKTVMV